MRKRNVCWGEMRAVILICVLSLLLMPAFTWLLAFHVFSMPPLWGAVFELEVGCDFCGRQYRFDAIDVAQLFSAQATSAGSASLQ